MAQLFESLPFLVDLLSLDIPIQVLDLGFDPFRLLAIEISCETAA